jgi:hypothetical protein
VNSAANPPQSSPVLYVAGSNVLATVTFTNHTRSVSDVGGIFPMLIKGEVSGGHTSFTLWGTNTAAVSANCVVETHADQPLTTNMVDVFQPMTVNWYYASINQTNWLYAGQSANRVYVSWQPPTTANLYHTVVDVACRNAIEQTNESNIVAGIWSGFTNRSVLKADGTGPMKYWGTNALAHGNDTNELNRLDRTSQLVKYADGQCGAWQKFFYDVLSVHGITSTQHDIHRPSFSRAIIIGVISNMVLVAIPGQNNPAPYNNFANHAVNSYGQHIYDPSYGNKWVSQIQWEDNSVAFYLTNTNSIFIDPKGTNETVFNPPFSP